MVPAMKMRLKFLEYRDLKWMIHCYWLHIENPSKCLYPYFKLNGKAVRQLLMMPTKNNCVCILIVKKPLRAFAKSSKCLLNCYSFRLKVLFCMRISTALDKTFFGFISTLICCLI